MLPPVQDGKLPAAVPQSVGHRALADLKSGMDSARPRVLDKWNAYQGGNPPAPAGPGRIPGSGARL